MGKSSSADTAAGQAASEQSRLARELAGESSPLRKALIGDAQDFVTGGRDVSGLPEFAAAKSAGEMQFNRARDSVIANTPEGGALTSALTNLEADRARSFTELSGALSEAEVNRGVQLATFGAAQGSQGLGAAAFTQSQRAAAEAQQNAAKGTGLGRLAGAIITRRD